MPEKDDIPFSEVPKSLTFTIAFSVFMFALLIYMSSQSAAIDPIMFYLIMGIYLVVLGLGTTEWRKMRKVLGFSTPYKVDTILLPVIGLGFAGVIHSLIINKGLAIFQGTWVTTALVPLYVPLKLPQYSVTLGVKNLGSAIFYSAVAIFEESYVLLIFKNLSNWLTDKGLKFRTVAIISLLISRTIWGSQHYLSWGGLNIFSIFFAVMFGILFYMPYFIVDASSLLSPKKTIKWTGIAILSAISFHFGYDFYLTEGMFLPWTQFLIIHIGMIAIGFFGMWLARRVQSGRTFVELVDRRSQK